MSSRDSTPPPVERIEAAAYTIPTDAPESDGTLEWDSTTNRPTASAGPMCGSGRRRRRSGL